MADKILWSKTNILQPSFKNSGVDIPLFSNKASCWTGFFLGKSFKQYVPMSIRFSWSFGPYPLHRFLSCVLFSRRLLTTYIKIASYLSVGQTNTLHPNNLSSLIVINFFNRHYAMLKLDRLSQKFCYILVFNLYDLDQIRFGLVSLFNGVSTFVGYLLPNPPL